MGKPGFVRVTANREDSEPYAELGMPCSRTSPHPQHTWQMSMTGWCLCLGQETTPIYDSLRIISDLR